MNTEYNTAKASENKPLSPMNIALKWALLGFLMQVIYELANFYVNDGNYVARPKEWYHSIIKFGIWFIPVFFAVKEHRTLTEDTGLPFAAAFKTGFLYGVLFTAFCVLFYVLFFNYLINWDTFMSAQIDESIAAMKARGMGDEEIKRNMSMVSGFFLSRTFTLLIIALMGILFQTIAALVVAAILKRNKTNA